MLITSQKLLLSVRILLIATLTTSLPIFSSAQDSEHIVDGKFHENLPDHLVGNWHVTGCRLPIHRR